MTREEEIKCASKDYVNYLLDKQEYHNEDYTEYDIRQAFEKGAKWADKNPNLDSLWHTPDEVPEPKKRLIIHCDEEKEWNPIDQLVYCVNSKYSWDETVKIYNILHWAYATDLVPNFNEKL